MFSIWRIFAVMTIVAVIALAMSSPGTSFDHFFDGASVIFFGVATLGVIALGTKSSDWAVIGKILRSRRTRTQRDYLRGRHVAQFARRTVYSVAVMEVLLSIIQMSPYLTDMPTLGAIVSYSLLPVLYAVFIAEVFLTPFIAYVEARAEEREAEPD